MKSDMQKMMARLLGTMTLLFCVQIASASEDGKPSPRIFRYKNAAGNPVTTYVLPPEASGKGYEIINSKGDVLETVKPAPTEAEKQAMLNEIEQKKYDANLLLQFGSLAELMKAQKRKNAELDAKMSILEGNLTNNKAEIESEQAKAANFERRGVPVPEVVLNSLEELYTNLEQTESSIHERKKEADAEQARYEKELLRYKQLKNLK